MSNKILVKGSRDGKFFVLTQDGEDRYLTLKAWMQLNNAYDLEQLWDMAVSRPVARSMGEEASR